MRTSPVPAIRLGWTVAGFTVWGLALVALYAILSIGCGYGWHMVELAGLVTLQRAVLVALLLLSLAAALLVTALTWRQWRRTASASASPRPGSFLDGVAFASAVAALGASIVTFGPTLVLTTCF